MDEFDRLVQIVARLRSDEGCPWDRQQTHRTLKQYFVEEVYEAIEAIDDGESAQLCGELGDVLLQVALHAQIASETGEFDIHDVLDRINEKLVYRHPHVFGDVSVSSADEVLRRWEQLKQAERDEHPGQSVLDGVPRTLPALQRAKRLQEKAARMGFDWDDVSGPWAKVLEEIEELRETMDGEDRERMVEELGEVLVAVVNVGRQLGISGEEALRMANNRFEARFRAVEQLAAEKGMELAEMSLAQMDELWEQVKNSEADAG